MGVVDVSGQAPMFFFEGKDEWYGLYIQDQIAFADRWNFLAGVRYDDAKTRTSFVEDRSDPVESDDSEFSPRVGLLYHPIPWLGVYASYVEGFNGENTGRALDGSALDPERSRQYEVGLKGDWWDGRLTSNLTLFDLTKENITSLHSDPVLAAQGFVELTREARSRGIELDIGGQISDDWRLIGSYSYTDAEVTEDPGTGGSALKGNRLQNVPRHAGSLWVEHQFGQLGWPGLSAGLGVFLASQREGDRANSFQLPGYGRIDAALKYSRRIGPSNLTVQFNVQNLLDKEYFVAGRSRTIVSPAEPLTFLGSIQVEF